MNTGLVINSVSIRTNENGFYCVNDLHKASGGLNADRPKYWLQTKQAKELILLIHSIGGKPPIVIKQGLGTFVAKQLVYSYAMWLSSEFALHVIDTFDYVANNSVRELKNLQTVITQQAATMELFDKREPRDLNSLAVILDKPSYHVQADHDLLERHGYLTSKDYWQKYTVKTPTAKLGNLCIGRKGNTLLYDQKIKELVRLLHETESLFN